MITNALKITTRAFRVSTRAFANSTVHTKKNAPRLRKKPHKPLVLQQYRDFFKEAAWLEKEDIVLGEYVRWMARNEFKKYKIKPPVNFEELFSACKILKNSNEIESPISWPAKKGQPLATSFILAMANFGKPYINLRYIGDNVYDLETEKTTLKANFLSEAAFNAAKMLKELISYSPSSISSHSNDECVEFYSQGKSAMVFNWSSKCCCNWYSIFKMESAETSWRLIH